jgi:hypothetical protein
MMVWPSAVLAIFSLPECPLEVHNALEPYVQVAGPVLPDVRSIEPDQRKLPSPVDDVETETRRFDHAQVADDLGRYFVFPRGEGLIRVVIEVEHLDPREVTTDEPDFRSGKPSRELLIGGEPITIGIP